MEFIQQSESDYAEWSEFLEGEKVLNSWGYTVNFMAQCSVFHRKSDLSFALKDQNRLIAICPLFLSIIDGHLSFTDDGGYMRGPLLSSAVDERDYTKYYKAIFTYIDSLAESYAVDSCHLMFDYQPLRPMFANILVEYGYLDTSIQTRIIDLSLSETTLKSSIRKSYKSLINAGGREYEFHVMNYENKNYELHECYRETHHKAAGRVTRPKKYFDLQYQDLVLNEASLLYLKHGNAIPQLDYFNYRNSYVYYSSAADDPDFDARIPLGHTVLWNAILHFKALGFNYLELGWQLYEEQLFSNPSDKEINISYFKRGFGGYNVPLHRGIKFFCRDAKKGYLEKIVSDALN